MSEQMSKAVRLGLQSCCSSTLVHTTILKHVLRHVHTDEVLSLSSPLPLPPSSKPPSVHTMPTQFHGRSQKFSRVRTCTVMHEHARTPVAVHYNIHMYISPAAGSWPVWYVQEPLPQYCYGP